MKKYLIWILMGIMAILAGIIIYAGSNDDEEVIFTNALKVMTGQNSYVFTMGEISATAYYGDMYLDNREKKELLITLAKAMGINGEFEFGASWENGRDMVCLYKKGDSLELKISMNTIETAAAAAAAAAVDVCAPAGHTEKTYAQYVVCRLNITGSPESVCHYKKVIMDELEKLGLYCDLTITFVSCYAGEFAKEKWNTFTDDILKSLGARVVAENRSEKLFSVYAYAADVAKGIAIGNDEININIAINYNEAAGQTRVYLATPIIGMEY